MIKFDPLRTVSRQEQFTLLRVVQGRFVLLRADSLMRSGVLLPAFASSNKNRLRQRAERNDL